MSKNEQLLSESAVELRRCIGTKEISPVELLEACIARIERINPAINAVTAVCYERAREEAKAAEKAVLRGEALGVLHGLPDRHQGPRRDRRAANDLRIAALPRFRPRAR